MRLYNTQNMLFTKTLGRPCIAHA